MENRRRGNRWREVALPASKLVNALLLTAPFAVAWVYYFRYHIYDFFYWKGNLLVCTLYFIVLITYVRLYDGFTISLNRITEMVYSQSLAALVTNVVAYIVIWLMMRVFPNPLPFLGILICQGILSTGWCYFIHRWYFRHFPPQETLILCGQEGAEAELVKAKWLRVIFRIRGVLPSAEVVRQEMAPLKDMESVFLCGVAGSERDRILSWCVSHDVEAYVLPGVSGALLHSAGRRFMFHLPFLCVRRYEPSPEYLIVKRAFDILVSGVCLLILSPVLAITALAIRLEDGGDVFYRQKRLTANGRIFEVLKFRSMRQDAEKDGVARLSTGARDDRVTRVGRIIRKYRIDELPQLINILRGDMTLVGPRPERPEIAVEYEREIPEFGLRLQCKAGLTGLAQVYGKYNTTPYDKLQMDLMYIARPSILEDLKILFATIKILFIPESTEGVAEGQTTASRAERPEEQPHE